MTLRSRLAPLSEAGRTDLDVNVLLMPTNRALVIPARETSTSAIPAQIHLKPHRRNLSRCFLACSGAVTECFQERSGLLGRSTYTSCFGTIGVDRSLKDRDIVPSVGGGVVGVARLFLKD